MLAKKVKPTVSWTTITLSWFIQLECSKPRFKLEIEISITSDTTLSKSGEMSKSTSGMREKKRMEIRRDFSTKRNGQMRKSTRPILKIQLPNIMLQQTLIAGC